MSDSALLASLTDEEIYLILEKRALVRRLRADGHTQEKAAELVGVPLGAVRALSPGYSAKRVPVAPLREVFLASSVTAADVARSLGWWTHGRRFHADSSRVKRTLGLMAERGRNGHGAYRRTTDAETVARIAEAIGISPWAVLPDEEPEYEEVGQP